MSSVQTLTRSSADDHYGVEALRERARALAPVLRERSSATAKARTTPVETIRDLWDADLWYLLKPKAFGGPEVRPDIAWQVTKELAQGDGSAAWVWAVMTIHDLLVALYPEEFQREYWGKDRTLSASSFSPSGIAKPADGGFTVSGKWTFCSGIDHADWVLLGTIFGPPTATNPAPDIRYVMVPKGSYQVIDDWFVFGLQGSGSKTVVMQDVFVPHHRILALSDMEAGTTPGAVLHEHPIYRSPIWAVIPFTIISPANGIARGGMAAFIDEMRVREGTMDHAPLSKKPGMQIRLAEASALIDAADLLYNRSLTETMERIERGETLEQAFRSRSRRDQAYSVVMAKQALELLFTAQGGRGLFDDNPVQRAFRDLQALGGHIVAAWDMTAQSYGSVILGGPKTEMMG